MTRYLPTDRSRGRQLAIGVAGLVTLIGASATAVFGSDPRLPAPGLPVPGYSGSAPCPADTLAHVHHPSRLVVVARCAVVEGTVAAVNWQSTDGDWLVKLALDPSYARFVPHGTRTVILKVIPSDVSVVRLPKAGDHIAASGAWVHNRNRGEKLELHPTWNIRQLDQSPPSTLPSPTAPDFYASASSPHRVKVGDSLNLVVTVTSRSPGVAAAPISLAHVWLEVVSEGGRAVQWKAGSSNSLGVAPLQLVALYRPGRYTTNIYVEHLGRVLIIHTRLELVR